MVRAATHPSAAPERAPDDALTTLAALVHDDLIACNHLIVANMHSEVELIPRLAAHLVAAGGKRLRPILTLASARLCGYAGGQRHVALAACVEFIHTATLLHDDVVDGSQLRRGWPAPTPCSATRPAFWSAIFYFHAPFSS